MPSVKSNSGIMNIESWAKEGSSSGSSDTDDHVHHPTFCEAARKVAHSEDEQTDDSEDQMESQSHHRSAFVCKPIKNYQSCTMTRMTSKSNMSTTNI